MWLNRIQCQLRSHICCATVGRPRKKFFIDLEQFFDLLDSQSEDTLTFIYFACPI